MVLLCGEVVSQRPDLYEEALVVATLDFRNALYCLFRLVVGVVNAGLVLAAPIVALPVLYRRVDNVVIGKQQRIEAHLVGVVFHPHGFSKAGVSLADGRVVGVRLAGAVCVAVLGIKDAGNGLHQLFDTPKASSCQVDDVFRGIPVHGFPIFHI